MARLKNIYLYATLSLILIFFLMVWPRQRELGVCTMSRLGLQFGWIGFYLTRK